VEKVRKGEVVTHCGGPGAKSVGEGGRSGVNRWREGRERGKHRGKEEGRGGRLPMDGEDIG